MLTKIKHFEQAWTTTTVIIWDEIEDDDNDDDDEKGMSPIVKCRASKANED